MHILMFGWEFPPHILGGLGTATFGIVSGLLRSVDDVSITLVIPRPQGDEMDYFRQSFPTDYTDRFRIIGANSVSVPGRGCIEFSGRYPANLIEEIENYRQVAAVVARRESFDLIHSHDWLTYPAGIEAKRATGKPLCVHVHATDYDRSRGRVNPTVYNIEKSGMEAADRVLCVSELTRRVVLAHYINDTGKTLVSYNAVEPLPDADKYDKHILSVSHNQVCYPRKSRLVTFLGRITMQKGPEYFVETAAVVLRYRPDVRFVMAGGGDKLGEMIELAASKGICDHFHFKGFLNPDGVRRLLGLSDVYIMPSVSEPFGISPLEAMQVGCPVILSHQSGCSEILKNVIKVNYWDITATANAIIAILDGLNPAHGSTPSALYTALSMHGRSEVGGITWPASSQKLYSVYSSLI